MITTPPPLLRLWNLTKIQGHNVLFEAQDFCIGSRTRVLGLVGASGSGKTTLLHLMAGLERPTHGSLDVLGRPVPTRRGGALRRHLERTALVLQTGNLLGHLTLEENVALPRLLRGERRDDALAEARVALNLLGLHHQGRRLPAQVSGGEAQRAAVARALASGAPLILADEPTASLDAANERAVFAGLRAAAVRHGRWVVIASHSPRVHRWCDRVLAIVAGRIVEVERTDELDEPRAATAPARSKARRKQELRRARTASVTDRNARVPLALRAPQATWGDSLAGPAHP